MTEQEKKSIPSEDPRDAEAQFKLGCAYMDGMSVPQNEREAIWGVPEDEKKALYWWTKAAEQGHAEAMFKLGEFYEYGGEYIEGDNAKEAYWYTKAAEMGHADAQCRVAYCYESGEGVKADKTMAVYWYNKAAEQGLKYAEEQRDMLIKMSKEEFSWFSTPAKDVEW